MALSNDYFAVFGLSRKLAIDVAELQRKFYVLAREHHPDFHQAAAAEERARVEAVSALVNAAYRTLRDPIARVDYLVRLEEGRVTREGGRPMTIGTLLRWSPRASSASRSPWRGFRRTTESQGEFRKTPV